MPQVYPRGASTRQLTLAAGNIALHGLHSRSTLSHSLLLPCVSSISDTRSGTSSPPYAIRSFTVVAAFLLGGELSQFPALADKNTMSAVVVTFRNTTPSGNWTISLRIERLHSSPGYFLALTFNRTEKIAGFLGLGLQLGLAAAALRPAAAAFTRCLPLLQAERDFHRGTCP